MNTLSAHYIYAYIQVVTALAAVTAVETVETVLQWTVTGLAASAAATDLVAVCVRVCVCVLVQSKCVPVRSGDAYVCVCVY